MPLSSHVRGLILLLLLLVLSASLPDSVSSSSCAGGEADDAAIVAAAFRHVRNFPPRQSVPACTPLRELRLPSRNLTGAVAWAALANLSALAALDLSGNALRGAIPGGFWRAPSLRSVDLSRNQLGGSLRVEPNPGLQSLNVSGNRFTGVAGLDGLAGLDALDVSANRIRAVPQGLRRLTNLSRLDVSGNAMQGRFPGDLPPLGGVRFLNVSYNNLSGAVNASAVKKFGPSAFVHAGNASLVFSKDSAAPPPRAPPPPPPPRRRTSGKKDPAARTASKSTSTETTGKKHLGVVAVAVVCGVASVIVLLCLVGSVACGVLRCRRRKNGDKEAEEKKVQWGESKVLNSGLFHLAAAPTEAIKDIAEL